MHKINLKIILVAALFLFVALSTRSEAAPLKHPAPSVLHDYIVTLTATELDVQSYLRVSPELVGEVYKQIDTNGDGQTSEDERQAWYHAHPSKLRIFLDDVEQKASLSQAPAMSKEDLLLSIEKPLGVSYTIKLASPIAGKHRIKLEYGDNYLTYDEYYISVAGDTANDGQPHSVAGPVYPATYQIVYHIPAAGDTEPVPPGEIAPPPFTAGTATPVPQAATTQAQPTPASTPVLGGQQDNGPVGGLLTSLRDWHGEIWAALGFLLLAFFLGALHALTPGHGKTMVAAYLVGTKGRVRDAVLLGGVVTFTHTAGVIVLGVVSNFFMPRALQPALELISGVLIIVLSGFLLISRWRALQKSQATEAAHIHAVPAEASPATVGAQAKVPALVGAQGSSAMPAQQTALATAQPATNGATPHTHDHDHSHNEDGWHSHGGVRHTHSPDAPVSTRSLIGLGIAGGIIPCPEALAILLLAASIGQFALGLSLVVSFSLGLATVLISIGIMLVKMRAVLTARLSGNPMWTRWVPVASAAVLMVVGVLVVFSSLGKPWS